MHAAVSGLMVLAAYGVGCLTAGYYLVRFGKGADIHDIGSGNVGARNVSRVLGRTGFAVTLALDMAKGMLVVWAARRAGLEPFAVAAAGAAVVAGHIWPLQFRFRGGKGIAAAIGVILALNWILMGLVIAQFLVLYVFVRSFTIAGLGAIAVTPLTAVLVGQPGVQALGIAAIAALVLFSHRENLAERLGTRRS
ncbi:MAG TPA: glycerol-3-phosphate acyltransferase [Bacillales bacterium]|nr:glycerol-3-phosphate acyltransferase [Bacillales bacterium]